MLKKEKDLEVYRRSSRLSHYCFWNRSIPTPQETKLNHLAVAFYELCRLPTDNFSYNV